MSGVVSRGRDFFSLCHCIQNGLGVHPGTYLVGTGGGDFFLGVKWLGHEADHPPLSSAEVKNAWNYTSIFPYIFMV
jgi:hypothetical protein